MLRVKLNITALLLITFSLTLTGTPLLAVEMSGVPGSAGSTATIPGDQLPPPPPEFGGKIKRNALQSTPWWPGSTRIR